MDKDKQLLVTLALDKTIQKNLPKKQKGQLLPLTLKQTS